MSGSGPDTPLKSGRIYRMSGSVQEALPDVRELSGEPLECW